MARELIESWQTFALKDKGYGKRKIYSAILSVMVGIKNLPSVELKLNGNQPLFIENRLNDLDIEILCKALQVHPTIVQTLDISYNSFTDKSVVFIADYLKVPDCSLHTLNLSHADIESGGIDALSNAFQFNKSVMKLELSGIKMGHKGGIYLASMLQINDSIQHLGLGSADLDTDCIIAMATVLHGNRALQSIDLSRPILHSHQEESTIHISKMLKVNVSLRELHLCKHGIRDSGMEWIARALSENHTLTLLDVSRSFILIHKVEFPVKCPFVESNELSRDGARHCAMLLGNNSILKHLDLSYNRIQDEGLVWISKALTATNNILSRLDICYNSIGDEGLCALAHALQINSSVQNIAIWGNLIGEPTCTEFHELLESGRILANNIDVKSYQVDGINYLAKIT